MPRNSRPRKLHYHPVNSRQKTWPDLEDLPDDGTSDTYPAAGPTEPDGEDGSAANEREGGSEDQPDP
jgi:hypothetical protein